MPAAAPWGRGTRAKHECRIVPPVRRMSDTAFESSGSTAPSTSPPVAVPDSEGLVSEREAHDRRRTDGCIHSRGVPTACQDRDAHAGYSLFGCAESRAVRSVPECRAADRLPPLITCWCRRRWQERVDACSAGMGRANRKPWARSVPASRGSPTVPRFRRPLPPRSSPGCVRVG